VIVLVTGSSGLVGSEAVRYFDALGATVHGIDNNMRAAFFGPGGDTTRVRQNLEASCPSYTHHNLDIRDRHGMATLFEAVPIDAVIHCAAQPSHDLARSRPFDDFDVNAGGTLNLLEATRRHRPEAVFCHMSTNKVYGDAPNERPLTETDTRWEYARAEDHDGIDESCRIDQSEHSVFGASKTAADVMAQEYARGYGLKVGVFRAGCVTGAAHAGVELHGFLNYFVKIAKSGGDYRVFGYKGKQVRDQIHAVDVVRALHAFIEAPRPGEVYNIGGGRANSASILECIQTAGTRLGRPFRYEYVPQHRRGDHICYISNLRKLRDHYPSWSLTRDLPSIWDELLAG
jgi:CDP-paratose 2-epimerase